MAKTNKELMRDKVKDCFAYIMELEGALDEIAIIIEEEEGLEALDKFNEVFDYTGEVYRVVSMLKKERGL